jgi:hypothetical protein
MNFVSAAERDPTQLLDQAARLTLCLALRCDWVEGCEDKDDADPDSWNGLYERIGDLMEAYINILQNDSDSDPATALRHFAFHLARIIANIPSLRKAIEADVASNSRGSP